MRAPADGGRAPQALEAGLFLLLVALPLVFTPFTAAPFADPKLVVLLAGSMLVAWARPAVDRRLALAAAAWVAALALATAAGRDPWWSTLGPENQGTGLLTLGAAGWLLCAGTGMPDDLRRRAPIWLAWSGVVVSVVAVAGRFVDIGGASWVLDPLGSTLGHRVFVGGFLAAATVSATQMAFRPRSALVGAALGSGLAVSAARSAWIGAALGLAFVFLRDRPGRRRIAGVVVPVVAAIALWTVADRALPEQAIEFSAAPRFTQLEEGSARERPYVWSANARAFARDPVLGSGPGTSWYGYLRNATPGELRAASRDYDDAHNVLVEVAATAGIPAVLALLAVGSLVVVRMRKAATDRQWAAAAALALAVVHGLQPLNLVLTPLLFLTAGLAVSDRRVKRAVRARAWLVVALAAALALSGLRFVASTLERYGSTYASERALRWSLRIEPRRFSATQALASHRGFDGRNDPRAGREARALARRSVRQHPWHPEARIEAANVEALTGSDAGARRWLDEHLRVFPRDPLALSGVAVLAMRSGDTAEAEAFARRALAVDPSFGLAEQILARVTRASR